LRGALEAKGVPYTVDEGARAFYGPNIDVGVKDSPLNGLGSAQQSSVISICWDTSGWSTTTQTANVSAWLLLLLAAAATGSGRQSSNGSRVLGSWVRRRWRQGRSICAGAVVRSNSTAAADRRDSSRPPQHQQSGCRLIDKVHVDVGCVRVRACVCAWVTLQTWGGADGSGAREVSDALGRTGG
jgi:hypothetical protein